MGKQNAANVEFAASHFQALNFVAIVLFAVALLSTVGAVRGPCEELSALRCGSVSWSAQLGLETNVEGIVNGRVCFQQQCEDVAIYLDSGWKATDIAIDQRLVQSFGLQTNMDDIILGSRGEPLPTYFSDAKVSVFVVDVQERRHLVTAMAGRISGLAPSVNEMVKHVAQGFVIAGPSMMKTWRLSMHFNDAGILVLHQCRPTLGDIMATWGAYANKIPDETLCSVHAEL